MPARSDWEIPFLLHYITKACRNQSYSCLFGEAWIAVHKRDLFLSFIDLLGLFWSVIFHSLGMFAESAQMYWFLLLFMFIIEAGFITGYCSVSCKICKILSERGKNKWTCEPVFSWNINIICYFYLDYHTVDAEKLLHSSVNKRWCEIVVHAALKHDL